MIEIYNQTIEPELEISNDDSIGIEEPARVILFNDNVHSFDDVITQLIKAIHCNSEAAEQIAWQVHTKGKACVFQGEMPNCLKVSGILEEIALHTQIEM
jgi:ATP-dependent Clp protease adaptor protein ClpS